MARGEKYDVVGRLPPGEGGQTALAVIGGHGGFKRIGVLRPVGECMLVPVANIDPCLLVPMTVDDIDGTSYAVYDFHPGATLKEVVDVYRAQEQLPPLGLAVRIVLDAARTMSFAHEHQDALGGAACFVHGGLSDSRLLLGFDGAVRVLDFGLRAVNRFSSPEAVRGGPFDPRSDVFSLGAALHAALTGFEGSYAQVLQKTPSPEEFPPPSAVHPDASAQLDSLVMKALLPGRDSRLASAAELADALERIAGASLPQPAACATRIRQLFEERLDGLRNMVPRLESDVSAAKFRPSRPQLPATGAANLPPPRRASAIKPVVQKPEARRETVEEVFVPDHDPDDKTQVKDGAPAAVANSDLEGEDDRTIVKDDKPRAPKAASSTDEDPDDATQVLEVSPSLIVKSRPTGEQPRLDKAAKRTQPHADVPWADPGSIAAKPKDTDMSLAEHGNVPTGADAIPAGVLAEGDTVNSVSDSMIEEVPTGLSMRPSGATHEEKVRAVGQELVSTGEVEPEQADAIRNQTTDVRASGSKKPVAPIDPDLAEMKTVVRVSGVHAKFVPPVLTPNASPEEKIDTGVIDARKNAPEPVSEVTSAPRKGGGARAVIALLLLLITGGFGYVSIKNPVLVRMKITAALIKLKLKKPPAPPPDDNGSPGAEQPQQPEQPNAAALAAGDPGDGGDEEDSDGGDEEEDDAGAAPAVAPGDAGTAARDGGAAPAPPAKHNKRKHHRPWWQTH